MRVYIVIGVLQGTVASVTGFLDPAQAEMELARLRGEYGIVPGAEDESESDAQLHEVEVDARPTSVLTRRQIW